MTRRFPLAFALLCILGHAGAAHADILFYATSYYSNTAYAVNSDGTTTEFATPIPHAGGITLDVTGNVYVGSETNNTIQKFSSTGDLLGTFTTDHISVPVGMAFDSSGNLYVANNASGSITEYSGSGDYLRTFATGLSAPEGLLIDASGNVYVSDIVNASGNGTITKYDASGAIVSTITSGLSYAGQMAMDNAGNLYVSNAGGDYIGKYNPQGTYQGIFAIGTGANNYGLIYDSSTDSFYQGTFGPSANPNGAIQHFDAHGNSLGYVAMDQPTAYFLAIRPRAVPEPGSLMMLGTGAIGVIGTLLGRKARANRA